MNIDDAGNTTRNWTRVSRSLMTNNRPLHVHATNFIVRERKQISDKSSRDTLLSVGTHRVALSLSIGRDEMKAVETDDRFRKLRPTESRQISHYIGCHEAAPNLNVPELLQTRRQQCQRFASGDVRHVTTNTVDRDAADHAHEIFAIVR